MFYNKRNLLNYLPFIIGLILLIILTYWYFSYYKRVSGFTNNSSVNYFKENQTGGQIPSENNTMDANMSNIATKQVETVLRNFENNYRIFQEDNQRLSSLMNNGISASDYTNALNYLNDVATRNNNFLQDLGNLRGIESDIAKTYGQPLFASVSEKVTQAENIINDSNAKVTELQRRILSSVQPTIPTVQPTSLPVAPIPVSPVVPVAPTPPVETVPVVPVTPTVRVEPVPITPVPTVPIASSTPVLAPVLAPVPTPAPTPTPIIPVTTNTVPAVVTAMPAVTTTTPIITDDSDIRAVVTRPVEVAVTRPVEEVVTPISNNWANQIPILVPGQVISQIPNPIVPSRFNNFAIESQALTAAASTMGAVEVRPDRINCLSSMQYYAPISSPGYPPPQPVISGSY